MTEKARQSNSFIWIPLEKREEALRLCLLAQGIWFAHYSPLVGAAQIDHMLRALHGPQQVRDWMADPRSTVAAIAGCAAGPWVGYVRLRHGDPSEGSTLLSKFYLLPAARGRGLGRAILQQVRREAKAAGSCRLWLTANRHNSLANQAYAALGFRNAGPLDQSVGAGYEMNDFLWEMDLNSMETT